MKNGLKQYITWADFLPVGLAVAMYISYMDISRDNVFLMIPVAVFVVTTGIKENIKELFIFIKRYWLFVSIMIIYLLYYGWGKSSADSFKFVLSTLGLVMAGYLTAVRSCDSFRQIYTKMWVFLIGVLILDMLRITIYGNGILFVAIHVELEVILIFACISFLYAEEKLYMFFGGTVSLVIGIILLGSDMISFHNATYIVGIIPESLSGSFVQIFLGRGFFSSRIEAPAFCENTFCGFLYDFGLPAFLLYVGVILYAIVILIKRKDTYIRRQALIVIIMLVGSAFYSMEIWPNIMFLIYTAIGILLGRYVSEEK